MKRIAKYIPAFLTLTGVLLFSSCKKGVPSSLLQPKEMEDVLYDYHLAQAVGNDFNGEERYMKELILRDVFEKHHTTQAQFDSSLVWYTRNTQRLSQIYENLSKRYQKVDSALVVIEEGQAQRAKAIVGDTVDIWTNERLCCLSTVPLANKLVFNIETTDTNFKARDSYRWTLDAHFLQRDTAGRYALMQLSVLYRNDSTASVHKNLAEGRNSLFLPTDTLPILSVRGDVYFRNDTTDGQIRTLLLHGISLMRYHTYGEPETEKNAEDSLATAVAAKDSLKNESQRPEGKDTIVVDSTKEKQLRLSPKELREQSRPQQLRKNSKPVPKVTPGNGNRRTRQTPNRR